MRSRYIASSCQIIKPLGTGLERLCHRECHTQPPDVPQCYLCFSKASQEGIRMESSTIRVIYVNLGKVEATSTPGSEVSVKQKSSAWEEMAMKNTGKRSK